MGWPGLLRPAACVALPLKGVRVIFLKLGISHRLVAGNGFCQGPTGHSVFAREKAAGQKLWSGGVKGELGIMRLYTSRQQGGWHGRYRIGSGR